MLVGTAIAIVLALVSTTFTNLAYLREHDAAAKLPMLCVRRPLESARLLLEDRRWLLGFAMESSGFLLYVAALALAPLALVQSVGASGLGVLAFASARLARRRLSRRELTGVLLSVAGLAALAISLADGDEAGGGGTVASILLWLAATAGVAVLLMAFGRRLLGITVAYAVAGGLLFSIGDVSTKVVTQGGPRVGFLVTLILGYAIGTALLQLGYQTGGALTVAGVATLLTNALPIAAGTIVLDEPVPHGALGGVRLFAFVAVVAGAVVLARPEKPATAEARMTPSSAGPGSPPGEFPDSLGRALCPLWTPTPYARTASKENPMTDLPERHAAAVERWVPMRGLGQVTERMQRMFDEAFSGLGWRARFAESTVWSPAVDVEETDEAYVIEAELASVTPADLSIEVVGDDLRITGEIKVRARTGTLRRQTRRTGRFAYRVRLPSHADPDTIDARLADGVLTVRVPKTRRDQRRRIEISAA